jgi:sec-independent protein translocase protein TatB
MFDFAWTEIALIGVVALVAIGPKDLPVAIKTVAQMIKKARRMAGEFQTHFDEMVREANLSEVRDQISSIRNFDVKGVIQQAVDGDGTIRKTFSENLLQPDWTAPGTDTVIAETPEHSIASPETMAGSEIVGDPVAHEAQAGSVDPGPPAFIPPAIANRGAAPAFIPPAAARL